MINMVKLSDVSKLTVGYVGSMEKEYTENGIKFLRSLNVKPFSFDLSDVRYITKEFNNKISKSILHTNDVVIVRTGIPGTAAVVPEELDGCNCSDLVIVRPDTLKINPHFLCAFINSWGASQIKNVKVGAVQKHFNVSSAQEMLVPFPKLEEQNMIADIIYNLNSKIALNNSICSDLESMAKLLYDYWFMQFDFPDENGRPYKSSGGKMVWNDELKREIPEGWDVNHISDYLDVITGKEDANFATSNGKYAFFTCSDDILKCDIPKFKGKAVLVAGNGNFNVKYFEGEFNAYQRTYVLLPKDEKYVGLLYYNVLQSINLLTKNAVGSIVKFITKSDVDNIVMLDGNKNDLLKPFNQIVTQIQYLQNENQELTSFRDFLLPMLMNGQIKIEKHKK